MELPSTLLPQEPARFGRDEFNRLLEHAKSLRASDLHLKTGARALCRVGGRMVPVTNRRLEEGEVGQILRTVYQGDNAELEVRTGRPLDGAYLHRTARDAALRFRWNATGCEVRGAFGLKLTLRELPEIPPALPNDLDTEVLRAMRQDQGIGLICGATGAGKSTLLAGIVRSILEDPEAHSNIMTAEAPIEFTFDRIASETSMITQSSVPHHVKTFGLAIVNMLRGDPDVIVVGEARDGETIEAAVLAAQTGHYLLTTVHSNTVGSTFLRMIHAVPKENQGSVLGALIDALRFIVCQRLYPAIGGGLIAVRETLVFDQQIRNELLETAAKNITLVPSVADALVRRYGVPMLEHAERRVGEGRLMPAQLELLRLDEAQQRKMGVVVETPQEHGIVQPPTAVETLIEPIAEASQVQSRAADEFNQVVTELEAVVFSPDGVGQAPDASEDAQGAGQNATPTIETTPTVSDSVPAFQVPAPPAAAPLPADGRSQNTAIAQQQSLLLSLCRALGEDPQLSGFARDLVDEGTRVALMGDAGGAAFLWGRVHRLLAQTSSALASRLELAGEAESIHWPLIARARAAAGQPSGGRAHA